MTATGGSASVPVLRNAFWLIGARFLAAPLVVVTNAVAGRYLGAADFGIFYLVSTYAGFAMLWVEWGQFGALTGKIALHGSRAGELLGSAMAWRAGASVVLAPVVIGLCALAGYGRWFLVALMLMFVACALGTVAAAAQDAVRGFERTDFAALAYVGQQLLITLVSSTALVLGFGLNGLLTGQILCAVIGFAVVLWVLPRLGIPRLTVRSGTLRELVRDGRPFLLFTLVMQLQPLVDGAMMSRFASAEALGWYAASRKLLGVLVFPVAAVGGALYPTLVRQFATDPAGCRATLHGALRAISLVVLPLAVCCALFPHLGVMIFNSQTFAPAEQNLRLLALWLLLVYASIPLSQCINASGRQGRWTAVQFLCVIISAVADPPLISWFQVHQGNGGLGVCVAAIGSEVLMVAGAVLLVPNGMLDSSVLRLLHKPALAAIVMIGVGVLAARVNDFCGALLSVLSYIGVLWCAGELRGEQLRSLLRGVRARAA